MLEKKTGVYLKIKSLLQEYNNIILNSTLFIQIIHVREVVS